MKMFLRPPSAVREGGFTLIELLIGSVVTAVLLLAVTSIVTSAQNSWSRTRNTAGQFAEARTGFDAMSRNLTQATLAPHWDYLTEEDLENRDNGSLTPLLQERYQRRSELHFFVDQADDRLGSVGIEGESLRSHVLGFQAPIGDAEHEGYRPLRGLVAGRVYYVQFGDDSERRPLFLEELETELAPRYRYRLMEYRPPSDRNLVYADARGADGTEEIDSWYLPGRGDEDEANPFARVLCENIIAFIVSPRNSLQRREGRRVFELAPGYSYDSSDPENGEDQPLETRNLLPPLVNVTMVAITEASASQLQDQWGDEEPAQLAFDRSWFTKTSRYYADLKQLEDQLQANRIDYRIFTASIRIRASQLSSLMRIPVQR